MSDQPSGHRRDTLLFATTLFAAGILVGCTDLPAGPSSPDFKLAAKSDLYADVLHGTPPAPNTASDQLAKAVPGFGGAFVANGVLNVFLTQNTNNAEGQAAARTAIHDLFTAGQRPQMHSIAEVGEHFKIGLQKIRSADGANR